MERLSSNPAELIQLRESGLSFPPVSFILYETSPYTYSEALFLYLVLMRRDLTEADLLVGSILENFELSLKTSAVPTPLIRKFQMLLKDPHVHYRFFDDPMELLRTIELHFRTTGHVYVYAVDPIESNEDFLIGLSKLVKKMKTHISRSFTLTVFIDENTAETLLGRKLSYQAELVYRLSRSQKTVSSLLNIMKTKFIDSPSITLEYSIGKEELNFQVIRTI